MHKPVADASLLLHPASPSARLVVFVWELLWVTAAWRLGRWEGRPIFLPSARFSGMYHPLQFTTIRSLHMHDSEVAIIGLVKAASIDPVVVETGSKEDLHNNISWFACPLNNYRRRVTLIQPSSTSSERLRSLRFVPIEHEVIVHGIRREIGRDVHPFVLHPLCKRDDVIEQVFGPPTNDVRPGEPGEKFGISTVVGGCHKS